MNIWEWLLAYKAIIFINYVIITWQNKTKIEIDDVQWVQIWQNRKRLVHSYHGENKI